jgi:hypothetical protein
MPEMTATQRLADHMLGGKLEEYVRTRRAEVPPKAWRRIALDLRDDIGLDVTYETLRSWYPEPEPETASVGAA